jgi:hypothetical protein
VKDIVLHEHLGCADGVGWPARLAASWALQRLPLLYQRGW